MWIVSHRAAVGRALTLRGGRIVRSRCSWWRVGRWQLAYALASTTRACPASATEVSPPISTVTVGGGSRSESLGTDGRERVVESDVVAVTHSGRRACAG